MYLVELDPHTGLIQTLGPYDGVRAIRDFRNLIDHHDFGIEAMTCVALVVDWLSPIRYYSESDKPKKAMYNVTGDRNYFPWDNDLIQIALKKYSELQYNPKLVEKNNLDSLLNDKLLDIKNIKEEINSIKELQLQFKETRDVALSFIQNIEDYRNHKTMIKESQLFSKLNITEKLIKDLMKKIDNFQIPNKEEEQINMFKQLNTIKGLLKTWNDENEDFDPAKEGPVVNGYTLTRLEEKLLDQKSFYNN